MRAARLSQIAIILTLLAGCGGGALRNSPDFRAGYSDGCASASLASANPRAPGLTRDDAAFRDNQGYHQGWGAGFGACRAMAAPATPGGLPPSL